jgi:hypothetical protein
MKAKHYTPKKFRRGVAKQVSIILGISQSAATMRLRAGNLDALELAIRLEKECEEREQKIVSALQA